MRPWWDLYPEQFEAEKTGFDQLGYAWQIVPESQDGGCLKVSLSVPDGDIALHLEAVYPDNYPYFPPVVFLLNQGLKRHQHLVGKNICLLAREGEDWRPGKDTLANLLESQLPQVLGIEAKGADSDYAMETEDRVGEPFSSFLNYLPNSSILMLMGHDVGDGGYGKLSIEGSCGDQGDDIFVRAALRDSDSDEKSRSLLVPSRANPFSGYWVRLENRPEGALASDPGSFYSMAIDAIPGFKKAVEKAPKNKFFAVAFIYQDEVEWRKEKEDWIFLAVKIAQPGKKARPPSVKCGFVRADWASEEEMLKRAPFLRPLRGKSVLVVGVGSLGSSLVIDLAKCGIGTLHLLDGDVLQAGNSVRWALGFRYSGVNKTLALKDHLSHEYPHVAVLPYPFNVGLSTPGHKQADVLDNLIDEVDLVIDASASYLVSHFLSDQCLYKRKDYLWLTTTHGCHGGVVGRILSDKKMGCWNCFQRQLGGTIPLPKDSGEQAVQPGGCSQATFLGAGIDSDEVAKLAARFAVATLSRGSENGYRDFPWDVAVGDFYDDQGPIAARWSTYPLAQDPDCLACK